MLKLGKAVHCKRNSAINPHSLEKNLKQNQKTTSVQYMLTYSSKKSSNSCVFYPFCCSVATEITHSHQVGIQSSCPLAKFWHLIHVRPSPQGTRWIWLPIWGLLSGPYSQPYKGPVTSLQVPIFLLKSGVCLHRSVQTHLTFCLKSKLPKSSEESLMRTHF